MTAQKPIGVFDSGIGGLTVARAINELMPNEQLIYFGDTAHFPYGDKEKSSVKEYCKKIASFLLEQNCKAIVVACNTASSASVTNLKKHLPDAFPLINVIQPVVDYVSTQNHFTNIGIIATKGTVHARTYPKLIQKRRADLQVTSSATPLLAPMIEEGFFSNSISKSIIASYLSKNSLRSIDCLILGCTHYPIIEKEIKSYYTSKKREVSIVNSANVVAREVSKFLTHLNILSAKKKADHLFFVSDYTSSFEESSKIFFGSTVKLTKIHLWK